MKTQIIKIFTVLAVVFGIATTTYAAPAKNESAIVLNDISAINKIEVHGNVEVYISDGAKDEVKVYNKYYAESALVQSKSGVLRITSYAAEKLVVWVTANDLRAVSAFDNADIKTFGNISTIDFDVDLHNNATAKLNLDAFNANVTVADQAKANLSGTVNQCGLKYSHEENLNCTNLVAEHTSKTATQVVAAAKPKTNELADL